MIALHLIHREKTTNEERYWLMRDVAIDTTPNHLETIIRFMFRQGKNKKYKIQEIVEVIGLQSTVVKRYLENLSMLGMVDKLKLEKMDCDGNKLLWKLSNKNKQLIEEACIY